MTIAAVVTRGYGSFGQVAFLPVRGYTIGAVVATPPNLLADDITPAAATLVANDAAAVANLLADDITPAAATLVDAT